MIQTLECSIAIRWIKNWVGYLHQGLLTYLSLNQSFVPCGSHKSLRDAKLMSKEQCATLKVPPSSSLSEPGRGYLVQLVIY